MNTFHDIWNNPKERLDFIIALIVCALFGIGILFFLPQNPSIAQEDNLLQNESASSSIEPTSLLAKDSEEITTTYSKKILTDQDLEQKQKGNFFSQKNPHIDSTKIISTHSQTNTSKKTSSLNTSPPQPKKMDVVKKKMNDVKKLSLDSLKISDFQTLEKADKVTRDSSKDLGNSTDKKVDELTTIKKNSAEGMDKESTVEEINVGKDTNSDNNKTSPSIKNTKPKSTTPPSKPKKDNIGYQSGDCIIVVGAFEKDVNAKKIIRQLKQKGYTVKTGWRKGLKYVGVPVDCQKDKIMQNTLQQLRKTFDIEAWVLKP